MRRVWGLTAFAAAILVPLAPVAGQGPSAPREAALTGAVTALSVVPGTGRADVVIAVDGAVDVMDFTLEAPQRIVIDLRGATLKMPASLYDKVSRGGIINIRMAQYREDMVRVVLDMDARREYTVVRGDHDVKISVAGSDAFAAWRVGNAVKAVVGDVAVKVAAPESVPAVTAPAVPVPSKAPEGSVPPAATAASGKLPAEPQLQEPRISVSFADANIREVLGVFATFAHRTIIMGKTVDGTVNATIDDQPWDVALKYILAMQGLSAIEDSTGIISVDSYVNLADRAKVEPLTTQVIQVNYAKAETMSNTVRSLLGAGCGGGAAPPGGGGAAAASCNSRGTVTFDEKTNTVIVTETPARLADITSYIRDLDIRTPQVTIKAKIIAVDRTGIEQLGLSYDLGSANTFSNALVTRIVNGAAVPGDYKVNLSGDGIATVANASRPYKSSSSLSLIYNMTLGGFNLTSFLDALASDQLTDVQAEPSVTTVDNKEATLFAGSNISFLLTPPIPPGQIQSVAPQIRQQDIGITLRVTPHVTNNHQVLLDVFAEQQTFLQTTAAGPTTNKRNSTNQVLVGDGETAVIGGLTQTQVTKNRIGIPFLMTLPGIGKLFSQESTEERKQDLLILITPHIVDEGEAIRAPAKKP
jgi:type IV pilus assembly protein PilQ